MCNKFDGSQSFVIPGSAPQLDKIRALIKDAPHKVLVHPKNGVFTMRAWKSAAPGQGQGS